jgi:NADPH-dependent ferric siderophore reductase
VRPVSRDYTPLYDEARHELALDFYIHDGGVASTWAMNAREGDKLTIGGPRGSLVVPEIMRTRFMCVMNLECLRYVVGWRRSVV